MNARHAQDLFRVKFPVFVANEHDWAVLAHGDATDINRIESFLRTNFSDSELIVRVSRKIGRLMSIEEAAKVIASTIGTVEMRIANRAFTELAVIGHPGVGTAWKVLPSPTTTHSPQ